MTQKNPKWTWDEEILAFDLYLRKGLLDDDNPDVIELSKVLKQLNIYPAKEYSPTFRNPIGVARKLADIHTHKPGFTGKPTSGSKLDSEVWQKFQNKEYEVSIIAALMKSRGSDSLQIEDDEEEIEQVHREGRIVYRLHRSRERDPKLRKRKIDAVIKSNGNLFCESCDKDLSGSYSYMGEAVYECHHLVPLSATCEVITTLESVVLLCPTCHRVAHRIDPWPSLEQQRSNVIKN